jgi:hypothetical protein
MELHAPIEGGGVTENEVFSGLFKKRPLPA